MAASVSATIFSAPDEHQRSTLDSVRLDALAGAGTFRCRGAWLTPGRFAPDANNFGTPASVRPGLVVSLRVVQEIDPTRLSWRG